MFIGEKKFKWVSATLLVLAMVLILGQLFVIVRFPKRFNDIVQEASVRHGVDPALIHAVILAESSYDPNAVSSAGAVGLMQIMPRTAEYVAGLMSIEFNPDLLFDPYYNINLGTFYLARLMRRFDLTNAIAAYNAGEGNVAIWIARDISPIPFPETRTYVRRVMFYKRVYRMRGV